MPGKAAQNSLFLHQQKLHAKRGIGRFILSIKHESSLLAMLFAYTVAPEMKNHLSYIPSMGAGDRSSFLLILRELGSSRSGEW